VETYSGKPAETLTFTDIMIFVWELALELLSYLPGLDGLDREVREASKQRTANSRQL